MKKKDLPFKIDDLPLVNPVQERLIVLYDNNFFNNEIAVLSGLPKKLINQIAKGKYLPYGIERDRFCRLLDALIVRLNINAESIIKRPDDTLDTRGYSKMNILKENLTIQFIASDKRIVCEVIDNIKYHLDKSEVTLYYKKESMFLVLRGITI